MWAAPLEWSDQICDKMSPRTKGHQFGHIRLVAQALSGGLGRGCYEEAASVNSCFKDICPHPASPNKRRLKRTFWFMSQKIYSSIHWSDTRYNEHSSTLCQKHISGSFDWKGLIVKGTHILHQNKRSSKSVNMLGGVEPLYSVDWTGFILKIETWTDY